MNSVNIRSLKHETGKLLERVSLGESIQIRRRNEAIALIKPINKTIKQARPDFRKRLAAIYGETTLDKTATELLMEERGDR